MFVEPLVIGTRHPSHHVAVKLNLDLSAQSTERLTAER